MHASLRSYACLLLVIPWLAGCGGSTPPPIGSAPLVLAAVEPSTGPVHGGTPLVLRGEGFLAAGSPATAFAVIGVRRVSARVVSDEAIEVVLPAGSEGAANVSVILDQRAAHAPDLFAYDPPPPRISIRPGIGSHHATSGGTRITIEASGFGSLESPVVAFGGVEASSVDVVGETTLIARVPPGIVVNEDVHVVLSQGARSASAMLFHSEAVDAGDLIVNELLANPGGVDANDDGVASATSDEFVELVNVSRRPLDLSGLTVHDASTLRHAFPNPTTLPIGGSIVVFGAGTPTGFAPRHATGHAQTASTGTLGLNNGGDHVVLRIGALELFRVSYAGQSTVPGVSLNNDVDGRWQPTPASAPGGYVRHDTLPEAVGKPMSPGKRADGFDFPGSN